MSSGKLLLRQPDSTLLGTRSHISECHQLGGGRGEGSAASLVLAACHVHAQSGHQRPETAPRLQVLAAGGNLTNIPHHVAGTLGISKPPPRPGAPPSLTYGKSGPLTSPGFPCPGWPPHSKAASQQLSADTPGSTWARLTLGQIVNWVWGPSKISPFGITLSPPLLSISPGSQGWGVCSGHQTHLSRDEEI